MLRVCRVLPPRMGACARSTISTRPACRRAASAATSPALPPPTTATSHGPPPGRGAPVLTGAPLLPAWGRTGSGARGHGRLRGPGVGDVGEVVGGGCVVGSVLDLERLEQRRAAESDREVHEDGDEPNVDRGLGVQPQV